LKKSGSNERMGENTPVMDSLLQEDKDEEDREPSPPTWAVSSPTRIISGLAQFLQSLLHWGEQQREPLWARVEVAMISRNRWSCHLPHQIPTESYTKNLDPSNITPQVAHHIVGTLPDGEEKARKRLQQLLQEQLDLQLKKRCADGDRDRDKAKPTQSLVHLWASRLSIMVIATVM
jgi:hypothetical protein